MILISKILNAKPKSGKKKKSKAQNGKKASLSAPLLTEVAFGYKEELQSDDAIVSSFPKTLYTLKDREGAVYALRGTKEGKLKEKEPVALALLEITDNSFHNGVILLDKNTYIFIKDNGQHTYTVEFISVDEVEKHGGIDSFTENYFSGYPNYLCDTPASIKKNYIGSPENTRRILLLVLILAIGVGVLAYKYQTTHAVTKHKPPKPVVQLPSLEETVALKREASIQFISDMISKVEYIATTNEPAQSVVSTRIASFSIGTFSALPAEQPVYDEPSNTWVYMNEKQKRGGISINSDATYEKRYPDVGYYKKEEFIYTKTDSNTTTMYYASTPPATINDPDLTISCISGIISIADITQRDENMLTFELNKKVNNIDSFAVLLALRKILDVCPAYLEGFNISSTDKTGKIYLYFDKKGA